MSISLRASRLAFRLWRPRLSAAGRAGPRRLSAMTLGVAAGAGVLVFIVLERPDVLSSSRDARLPAVDPLPGGLHSTPEQDALARQADTAHAQAALAHGVSFTPPLAASMPYVAPPRGEHIASAPPPHPASPVPQPQFVGRTPLPRPSPIVPVTASVPAPPMRAAPAAAPLAQAASPASNAQPVDPYSKPIGDLFTAWGVRPPQTDVVLPPPETPSAPAADPPAETRPAQATRTAAHPAPADPGEVLIPAGRGVYAHPVLAVNSDASSPVVLQADTGPIAGDRMTGSFARQNDRLVIHVNIVVHDGQSISVDGLVIAPDTMEASVASGMDEHYVSRIILPAAAAFVQGLGQAIATTSNTAAVISPFGGITTATNLNFQQQLGVAAGTAAGQIGSVLQQQAPKGPTVTLDANVAIGVMFLTPVILHHG
ncbi:MAG TPA: DotG/IcmE/VirB10 family protein [Acidisphaera sp.]|nr:DotG/IcmE/VirB10 family protein [Acidisphaera sp.]